MKTLMIRNDAPCGTERTYNGRRLSGSLVPQSAELRVFLMATPWPAQRPARRWPSGYYNTQNMLGAVIRHGGTVGVCGSCIDARGIAESKLAAGARRSTLDELTAWTFEAASC